MISLDCNQDAPFCPVGNGENDVETQTPHATKFTIYTNGTKNQNILDYAVRNSRVPMEKVQDHRKACLVVVFKSTYETYEDLTASDHWRYTTKPGQNHLFWLYSRFSYLPRVTSDHPFQLFDPGMAAVASDSLDKGYIRYGYDMALALPTPNLIRTTPQTVKKEYLLQFRGSVRIANSHPGYHHRWLAGEYWEESDTVKVDIECWYKHSLMKTMLGKEYTYPSSVYRDWTEKSIFGFAPGGSGPGSYRFVEILHAGGIPVVVDSFLPPLYPDIDWSRCLVTISPSQIVDLPRLLSLVRDEEIAERQRECDRLFHTVIGLKNTESDERVTFTRAMEIWEQRVHGVIEMNKIRD